MGLELMLIWVASLAGAAMLGAWLFWRGWQRQSPVPTINLHKPKEVEPVRTHKPLDVRA